ncbi:MAG TPA: T9SS type A sorting domain-containing protein, partial [Bacteroidia bacterium]|nr:T9SS type A sorting domain-containing protein [Bacteroidia bacterium]
MIKKLFTLGLALVAFAGNAQQLKKAVALGKNVTPHTNWASKTNQVASTYSVTIDTLIPTSLNAGGCGTVSGGIANYLAYSTQDSGYAFGTSIPQTFTYNIGTVVTITATTTGLAQKYNVGSAAATITNVLVVPGAGAGTSTTTKATIYNGTTNSIVSTSTLGVSSSVAMSAYATAVTATTVAQGYVSYSFASPVSVAANANFFAGISVPNIGGTDKDTMSVLTTVAGCSSNSADSLSWISTTYVIPTAGTQVQWDPVKDLFGSANNLDLLIFPVIDITTSGINDYVRHGDLSIYAASPNPANTTININFAVAKPSATAEVQVYDITGKIVKTIKSTDVVAGKNAIAVDVTSLEAGSYL